MSIIITFSGDFVVNKKVSMRTMAQTYMGVQKALERAYLDIERGGISKRDTIRDNERKATEFYLESYGDGSFRSVFKEVSPVLKRAIDRLSTAINDPYRIAVEGEGDIEHQKILQEARRVIARAGTGQRALEEAANDPTISSSKQYAKKSISNYISDSLVPVKSNDGDNSIKYQFLGDLSYEFFFNKIISSRFSRAISAKDLGPIFIYESYVVRLDSKNQKGIIKHKFNNKEVSILFTNYEDYNKATSYLQTEMGSQ